MATYTERLGGLPSATAQYLRRGPGPYEARQSDRSALAQSMAAPVDPLLAAYDNFMRGLSGEGQGGSWFGMNSLTQELRQLGEMGRAAAQSENPLLGPEGKAYMARFFDSPLAPGFGAMATVDDVARGAGNVLDDLPMDEASRMARAREMGFDTDTVMYHGSGADVREFDPINPPRRNAGGDSEPAVFFTADPADAAHYAETASMRDALPGEVPNHEFEYMGKNYRFVYDGASVYPALIRTGKEMVVDAPGYNIKQFEDAISEARRLGYDTVRFVGTKERGVVNDQIAVLNPANIRSRFARFDPRNIASRDILASGVAGLMGVLGLNETAESDR